MFWPSIGMPWPTYPATTSRYAAGPRQGAASPSATEAGPAPPVACVPGMIDLSDESGLPLWLDPRQEDLVLAQPLRDLRADPQPRRLLSRVLLDPKAEGPEVPNWVYRGVALATDEGVFSEHGVRHDLLLLRSGRLGREFVKTWGHTASCEEGESCPEVYGVLHGHGLFLVQQLAEQPAAHGDVRWIEAQPAQKVIVPADYGVVIVNLGLGPLVLSRLVAAEAWPIHRLYDEMQGAAYYVVEQEGEVVAEANTHYPQPSPPIRKEAPLQAPDLGVEETTPLYSAFVHHPDRFGWLRQGTPARAATL